MCKMHCHVFKCAQIYCKGEMTHVTQETTKIRSWTIISWNHENVICSIIFHLRDSDDRSFRGLIETCQQNKKNGA